MATSICPDQQGRFNAALGTQQGAGLLGRPALFFSETGKVTWQDPRIPVPPLVPWLKKDTTAVWSRPSFGHWIRVECGHLANRDQSDARIP